MALTDHQRRIAIFAQEGHEEALAFLKKEFKPPASPHNPHYFYVHPKLLVISDSHKTWPDTRREVMHTFPRIARDRYFDGKRFQVTRAYGTTSEVANLIKRYPSLTAKISAMAFNEIDEIEAQLAMYDGRPKHELTRLRSRLNVLTSGQHPVWENWVLTPQEKDYNHIDNTIHQWLDEPVDMDECDLFKPGWEGVPYPEESAKQFFDKVSEMHQLYLDVEKKPFERTANGLPMQLYTLACSITVANKRAKALGANFRFEARK